MNQTGTKIETEEIWRRLGETIPFASPETSLAYRFGAAGLLVLLALGVVAWSLRNKAHRHAVDVFVAAIRGLIFFVPAVAIALGRTVDNEILWWGLTGFMLILGIALTVVMYVKDSATIGYWAVLLAPLRMVVYTVLAWAFMLPSLQTWEETEKRSRVLVVIDVSPSVSQTSDDIARSGTKSKTRLDKVIDLLTDENVALLQKIKDKNPVFVYRLGTRIDDEAKEFPKDSPNWAKDEWEAWAKYDFRPSVLAGLSPQGQDLVKALEGWKPEEPGNADWATALLAAGPPENLADGEKNTPNDKATFKANAEKLKKRIDVARSIVLGTNVPDSLLALVNREAPNMVQGIVVVSDGRSNLGSQSSIAEMRERAAREKIPVFTITVGEARENIAIAITDLQVPDRTQPEEPTKLTVGVQGIGLANQSVPVRLGLYLPGIDPKKNDPSFEIVKDVKFAPGEPPLGEIEFTLDADELAKDERGRALVEDSKKVGRSKQLKSGAWQIVAKVARDKREVFAEPDHLSPVRTMQVIDKPIRVLLFASGPSREYQTLRTLLVREMDQKRAEVSIYLQTEGGVAGEIVQDVPPERLLTKFPDRLDTNKTAAGDTPEGKLAKYYNLDEYDLIIAFDPDWNEKDKSGAFRIPETAIKNVETWVSNLGGGLMYVAGPVHTFQLARADETNRLRPLLNILPIVPEDLVLIKGKGIPREPRRVLLKPSAESPEMLKLEDGTIETGGWEKFFTGKDEYRKSEVPGEDSHPRRGFYSFYPVKVVKPGATTWAEFWDYDDKNPRMLKPFLVTSQPGAGRTGFLASGEIYRMRAENLAYFDRFWLNTSRFLSAKREAKASRGRVLMNKEFVSGSPIRVQTRLLSPSGEPYPENGKSPKFEVSQYNLNGELLKKIGIYETKVRKSGNRFDGYYQGQLTADPKNFPTGDFRYKVTVEVPDSPGDVLDAEFLIRKSDPELDNVRPDYAAMMDMAGTLSEVVANITDPATVAKLKGSAADPAKAKLAYRIGDTDKIELVPQCFSEKYSRPRNLSGIKDIWDREVEPPANWKAWLRTPTLNLGSVQTLPWWTILVLPLALVSGGLLILGRNSQTLRIVGLFVGLAASAVVYAAYSFPVGIVVAVVATLLSIEWLSRKLLRLA
jgi:hypothetical protein